MCGKGSLEGFKVLHPFDCKLVWLYVSLIEDQNEGQFCLVQNADVILSEE